MGFSDWPTNIIAAMMGIRTAEADFGRQEAAL
jgi:hypothetical protein